MTENGNYEMRPMRRARQQLSQEETVAILERNSHGVLALAGDGGYPYAVPLSYVYADGKIYFHCARSGHKIDAIKRDPRVSFCVIDLDDVVPADFTTIFRSAIVFGKIRILESDDEKRAALEVLSDKYCASEPISARDAEISRGLPRLLMLEMTVEAMSGKHSKELVRPDA